MKVEMKPSGDSGLILVFGDEICEETNRAVSAAVREIESSGIEGIMELIPTYVTVLISYDPLRVGLDELTEKLGVIFSDTENSLSGPQNRKTCIIPVCYGGEYGPDLGYVAEYSKLSEESVVKIHAGAEYLVYMIGFTPGFPYLGGMDERLATPRLLSPREKISAGAVGIAGHQTGIYPIASPGGWQIIGRTPLRLFDAGSDSPALLEPGMNIVFRPVGRDEYIDIEKQVEEGIYELEFVSEGGACSEKDKD